MDYEQRMQTILGSGSQVQPEPKQEQEDPFQKRMDALLSGAPIKPDTPAGMAQTSPPQPDVQTQTQEPQNFLGNLVGAPFPKPEFMQQDRPEPAPISAGEMVSKAIENVPKSAVEYGKSLITPFVEPAETWEGMKAVGSGLASKAAGYLGAKQDAEQKAQTEAAANAVGQYYKNRYGSIDAFMNSFADDPIGVLADASSVFTLGGSAAARMPGVIGKAGKVAQQAGQATDPIGIALKGPKLTAELVSKPVNFALWMQSGASYNSLDKATKAGLMANPAFARHMSGAGTIDETVGAVRDAIRSAADRRSSEYLAGMKQIDNPAALNYGLIDDAMIRAREIAAPKGRVFDPRSERVQIYQDVSNLIDTWKNNPRVAHDIQSFDQLKQELRRYGTERTAKNTPERRMVDELSNAAKQTILNADERYGTIMERYAAATDELNEFTKELASGATTGAKFRKLMSGADKPYKKDLIAELSKYNPDIPYMIAGQELKPWVPQGLRGYLGNIITSGGVYGMAIHPYAAAGAIMGMPRVAGNIAYRTGQMGSLGERVYRGLPQFAMPMAYQAGVSERVLDEEPKENREGRATGGKVVGSIAQRLIAAAEKAHKYHQKTTEEILDAPDEHVVKALAVANKHI